MRAIILAAGEGTRLRPHTLDRPKCLVELAGRPLLAYQFEALESVGVRDVTVVTGYRAEQIAAYGRPMRHNPEYARTNMVASLMCAADLLDGGDDVLIAYSDIVYEPRVIVALRACPEPLCTTVDTCWLRLWRLRRADPLADAETLKLDEEGDILELGRRPASYDDIQGQYLGLTKVRADCAAGLVAAYERLDPKRLLVPFSVREFRARCSGRRPGRPSADSEVGRYQTVSPKTALEGRDRDNIYMTSFLQYLIDGGQPVRAVLVAGGWLEVDSSQDLELYNRLHRQGGLDEYCRLASAPAWVLQP